MKNINEILETGAQIRIVYFLNDKEEAKEKLKPFLNEGELKQDENEGTKWFYVENEKVRVTAFYEQEELQYA